MIDTKRCSASAILKRHLQIQINNILKQTNILKQNQNQHSLIPDYDCSPSHFILDKISRPILSGILELGQAHVTCTKTHNDRTLNNNLQFSKRTQQHCMYLISGFWLSNNSLISRGASANKSLLRMECDFQIVDSCIPSSTSSSIPGP